MEKNLKIVYFFSWVILVFVIISLEGGGYTLYINSIGKNALALFIFKYLLIPYIVCLVLAMRGSLRARFILFSFLFFFLYCSIANIMGVIYDHITGLSLVNALYLNGSIFSLILICLNRGFRSMDFRAIKKRFTPKTPRMQTAVFFIIASIFILADFIYEVLRLYPEKELTCLLCIISKVIVFILILIPIYITTTVSLFKNRPLGYVLAPIFLPICIIIKPLFILSPISIVLEFFFLKSIKKVTKKNDKV